MTKRAKRNATTLPTRLESLACAALLLVACGEGRPAAQMTGEQGDVAGGETSEFSGGDIPFCPEEGAAIVALDLESPNMAAWAALAAGHHELSLRWASQFPADAVRGYEEQTTVTLDVTVQSARDVIFGEANLGYEGSGCKGSRQRQIELAIEVRTADGALSGSFTHWVTPQTNPELPGGRVLSSTNKAGNTSYPFSAFGGALELAIDLGETSEQARDLAVWFDFRPDGVRGVFESYITTWGANGWGYLRPLAAAFPADGCGIWSWPVGLDERARVLADTPRSVYRSLRSELERGPIPALWQETSDPPREGRWTEVTLRGGEPTNACQSSQGIVVHAPLTVQTADGIVDHTQTMMTGLYVTGGGAAGRGGSGEANVPFVAASDFARVTGLRDFDLGDSEYAGAQLRSRADSNGAREGTLYATSWRQGEARGIEPVLSWCDGPECQRFWCSLVYQTSDCVWP